MPAGFTELISNQPGIDYGDLDMVLRPALTMVVPVLSPAQLSSTKTFSSSGASNVALLDVGVLMHPPKTSANAWCPYYVLLLMANTAWPNAAQLAAMVGNSSSSNSSSSSQGKNGSSTLLVGWEALAGKTSSLCITDCTPFVM
jgi:hypothetical protein